MTAPHLAALLAGLAVLAAGVAAWTGRWRGWARGVLFRPAPLAIAPPLGAFLLAFAVSPLLPRLAGSLLGVLALLAAVVAFPLALADPRWFGPRWYREVKQEPPDLSVAENAVVDTLATPRRRGGTR